MLSDNKHIEIVGIGQLVRREISQGDKGDPFFAEIKQRYDSGIPQRDEVVLDLIKRELTQSPRGVIFDNFPFSRTQAKHLDEFTTHSQLPKPIIIYLKIDPATAVRRVIHRKVCSECGENYIDSQAAICEKCGGSLVSRSDDNEDTVKKRIEHYLPRIREVVEWYKPSGRVIEIDGEPPIEIVYNGLIHAIERIERDSASIVNRNTKNG